MPLSAPIVLNLYDPESQEITKTYTQVFVPWKLLKKGIRLQKQMGKKEPDDFEEKDIDALASYILTVFPKDLTIEMLDEQSDVAEMFAVVRSIVSRAKGIMDPTLPPKP
ncbi:MAG: hypothetical protein L0287_16515 [Anaerolineae bacterium]|nr:hypothetical protein [Anaerolineae bacterium]